MSRGSAFCRKAQSGDALSLLASVVALNGGSESFETSPFLVIFNDDDVKGGCVKEKKKKSPSP